MRNHTKYYVASSSLIEMHWLLLLTNLTAATINNLSYQKVQRSHIHLNNIHFVYYGLLFTHFHYDVIYEEKWHQLTAWHFSFTHFQRNQRLLLFSQNKRCLLFVDSYDLIYREHVIVAHHNNNLLTFRKTPTFKNT